MSRAQQTNDCSTCGEAVEGILGGDLASGGGADVEEAAEGAVRQQEAMERAAQHGPVHLNAHRDGVPPRQP